MMCKVIGFLIRGGLEMAWVFLYPFQNLMEAWDKLLVEDGMLSAGYVHIAEGRKVNFNSNVG